MNNKGFTLVEIIVIMGVLALATIVVSSNLIRMSNSQKQAEYKRIVEKIETAAETYTRLNIAGIKDVLKKSNPVQSISLKALVQEGMLAEELLIDPRGNTPIDWNSDSYVVIVRYTSASGLFTFEYNRRND